MNPLIYWIVNGNMFLAAAGMLLAAAALRFVQGRRLALIRGILLFAGAILATISAEAIPYWLYAAWGAAIIASLWASSPRVTLRPWARRVLLALPILAACGAIAWAIPYRIAPGAVLDRTRPVYVIGDSISAGMGSNTVVNWPTFLRTDHGLNVMNLAMPGATAQSALEQAAGVMGDDCIVILEIGGNDMLVRETPNGFEKDLETLIARVESPRRMLVMFELPLPPLANRFGLAQRRAAKKHGIILLPRTLMCGVLATPGATCDGLHLSDDGHKLLAERVAVLFR